MNYKKAAVIGAGAMGSGIAQVLATASLDVVLMDIKTEFVESGLKRIAGKFDSDIKKGKLVPEEKDRILGHIKGSIDHQDASDTDLVIEAVIEDRKIKGELFLNLNKICQARDGFCHKYLYPLGNRPCYSLRQTGEIPRSPFLQSRFCDEISRGHTRA